MEVKPKKITSSRLKCRVETLEIRRDLAPFGFTTLSRKLVHTIGSGQEGMVLVGGNARQNILYQSMSKEYKRCFPDREKPKEVLLPSCKASQLLLSPTVNGYYAVAPAAIFTRHSGTCRVLGGAIHKHSVLQELHLGDILRLGSVGLVVSEICLEEGQAPKFLTASAVECLQQDAASVLMRDVAEGAANSTACQSTDKDVMEDMLKNQKRGQRLGSLRASNGSPKGSISQQSAKNLPRKSSSGTLNEERMCYVCFDDADSEADPILAPCQCSGGTKWIHLNCLQTWSKSNQRSQVCLAVSPEGAPVCTVCKTSYRSTVRTTRGTLISLRAPSLKPPYIAFTIVTRHHGTAAEPLFSTKFYVSFNCLLDKSGNKGTRGLSVGRSHRCDMMLDCQTVSVMHGLLFFNKRRFLYRDTKSKNGSMLYLREPLLLETQNETVLKWGDAFVTLTIHRSPAETIQHFFKTVVGKWKSPQTQSSILPVDEDLEKMILLSRNTSEIPGTRPRPRIDRPSNNLLTEGEAEYDTRFPPEEPEAETPSEPEIDEQHPLNQSAPPEESDQPQAEPEEDRAREGSMMNANLLEDGPPRPSLIFPDSSQEGLEQRNRIESEERGEVEVFNQISDDNAQGPQEV